MKKFVLVAAMLGSLVSGETMAACGSSNRLKAADISLLLGGNTVCVPTTTIPDMTWQELHVGTSTSTSGALIDYKRGPTHPTDKSETVGNWSVTGTGSNASVTHTYSGGGGTYIYTVHGTGIVGTDHSFCVGATEIVAKVKSGGGAC